MDHSVLQVESFERNVAACAVGADVFEIAVGNPIVDHSMTGTIVQHQQEDSLAQGLLFGPCAEHSSRAHRRILFWCVLIRRIGSGRDRRHFRLHGSLGFHVVARIKRVSVETEAGIKKIKFTGEAKQRQKRFKEADLGHAVEQASGGRKPRKVFEEETAMKTHGRRNERDLAVEAAWKLCGGPEKRRRNPRKG